MEAEVADGVWVDLALEGGLIVEVDGPSHFATDLEGRVYLTGSSALKRRLLRRRGFDVRSLPYWAIPKLLATEPELGAVQY